MVKTSEKAFQEAALKSTFSMILPKIKAEIELPIKCYACCCVKGSPAVVGEFICTSINNNDDGMENDSEVLWTGSDAVLYPEYKSREAFVKLQKGEYGMVEASFPKTISKWCFVRNIEKYEPKNNTQDLRQLYDLIYQVINYADRKIILGKIEDIALRAHESGNFIFEKKVKDILDKKGMQGLLNQMPSKGKYFKIDNPDKKLEDLILDAPVKAAVNDFLEEYRRRDELLRYNLKPRNKILLYGPPGNGKTSLASAIAHELDLPILKVKYSEIINSYLGKSMELVNTTFKEAAAQSCVLFFDELDSVANKRNTEGSASMEMTRILNTILISIDDLPGNVVFIGATNMADHLDPAFERRMQSKLVLKAPSMETLEVFLRNFEEQYQISFDIDLQPLAKIISKAPNASYALAEEIATEILRKMILSQKQSAESIVDAVLEQFAPIVTF